MGVGILRYLTLPVIGVVLLALAGGGVASPRGDVPAPAAGAAHATARGLTSLPAPAQSAVSETLGAASPAFAARRLSDGYRLKGGGVTASLDAGGVSLQAGGVTFGMAAAGMGRGGRLEPAPVRSVGARANRVSLDRGALTEWYVAGPLGIEQGFTLSRRPAGDTGRLTLALRLSGDVRARLASGTVVLTRDGKPGMSYGQLWASDANGRPLRAKLQLRDGRLLIHVWDRGASYPLTIDPLIQQGNKLIPNDETGAGRFGYMVALSDDGNTALIGGPADNSNVGAAWVFTRTGSTWTQQGGKLTGTGATGTAGFGLGVALSADGNTALIGGAADNSNVGAAWVFTRSGSTWTQQGGKLTGSGGFGQSGFGWSVALSADGNTALIGGQGDFFQTGAAWVLTRTAGVWTQQGGKLTGSGASIPAWFGNDVALSADGNTALIGGPIDTSQKGAAWVFTRTAGTWSPQGGKLTSTGSATGALGWSVDLSSDGDLALLGAPNDAAGSGMAYWFARSAGTWSQLSSSGVGTGAVGNARFGSGVAMSSDGNTALIGGNGDNTNAGAAWVFARSGDAWIQQGTKLTGGGQVGAAEFGYVTALSSDGNTSLIGGHHDNSDAGAAWVFANATVPGQPTAVTATPGDAQASVSFSAPASDGGAPVTSYTVTSSPGGLTATGAGSPLVVTGLSNGTSYTFTVTATNAAGTGPASAPSSAVTPLGVPGAPTGATATLGNAQASVSFSAPASNGGAAITLYTVTSSPGGHTATGAGSPIDVTGLTNGTSYTFTVTATNAVGEGPASAPSTAVTPRTVPGAPTGVAATPGDTQASVGFTPPASNGGAPITSYTVTSSPGGHTATGAGSPIVVTGLTNGTSYTFTVKATNVAGEGAASAPSSPVTPRTVPGAPTGVSATPGDGQASVSFSAPSSDGGAAISSYTVTSSPGGHTATGAGSPLVVTGLTNGTSYTFTVKATNVAGEGAASAPSSAVTPRTVPGQPTGATATAGVGQASVSFSPPISDGGAAITSYTVTSSPGGHTATGAGSPLVVTGLTNGVGYTFTVTAHNVMGDSVPSTASNTVVPGTTPVAPGAPTGVTATAGNGQAIVAFMPPASDGGAAITSYTVTASPGGQTATAAVGPIAVTGLTNGTSYTFTVTATNSAGTGPASASSNAVVPAGTRWPPAPPSEAPRATVPSFTTPAGPRVPPPGH